MVCLLCLVSNSGGNLLDGIFSPHFLELFNTPVLVYVCLRKKIVSIMYFKNKIIQNHVIATDPYNAIHTLLK